MADDSGDDDGVDEDFLLFVLLLLLLLPTRRLLLSPLPFRAPAIRVSNAEDISNKCSKYFYVTFFYVSQHTCGAGGGAGFRAGQRRM